MKRPAGAALFLVVPSLVLGGCGREEADSGLRGPAFTTRDSAWIEIVEVSRDVWSGGEGWLLDDEPDLVIGASGGTDELYRVRGAVRLSDGRIAVANAGTQEIRVFDGSGRFLHAMGGEGEGPGELRSLFSVSRRGDTLVAHDFLASGLDLFDGGGTFLGSVQLERDGSLPLQVFPAGEGYVALHLEYTSEIPEDLTYVRRPARYVRYDARGARLGVTAELPGLEMLYRGQVSGDITAMSSRSPLVAQQQQETVVGDRLVAGITDRFELRVYGPNGELERLIRAPYRERTLTGEEWNRIVEEAIADGDDTPEARRLVTEMAELAPPPGSRPAFGRFVGDPEGFVWVAPYRPDPGPTVPWLIVDVNGPILGTVDLPRGFLPREIGRDYVLGTSRDELDVETIRLYGLTRRGPVSPRSATWDSSRSGPG